MPASPPEQPIPQARGRRVEGAGGLSLAVQEHGDPTQPTIVLVHGYPDDHAVWDLVVAHLVADHHVVTYDVRGAGDSGVPSDRAGYRLANLVEDLVAVADAVSPDEPVHVVAHDWGSIQSWSAVLDPTASRRIASYTSMSGPGLDHVAAWTKRNRQPGEGRLARLARQSVRSWYIGGFQTPMADATWRRVAPKWPQIVARREGATVDERWPGPNLERDAINGLELYRANMFDRSRPVVTTPTDVPAQLIVATGDSYVTTGLLEGTELLAPNLVRREIAAKHWLPRTKPDLVASMVAEHVAAVGGGPSIELPDPDAPPVVVVTGAGSGIGRAVCLAYATRGARIVATDLALDSAEDTAAQCRSLGAPAEAHAVDVTDPEAMDALAQQVAADHGGATVVVNNAGLGMAGAFLDTSDDDWASILDVNLWGVIRGSRAFAQQMVAAGRPGHIVNVASAAAFTPSRTMSVYATSKAAVLMLSECLRAELADSGIGVSAICPGFVDTGIATATRYVGASEDEQASKRQAADQAYKRRNLSPDVVAAAVLKAVDRNLAMVPVGAEAHGGLLAHRLVPGLGRRVAKVDLA